MQSLSKLAQKSTCSCLILVQWSTGASAPAEFQTPGWNSLKISRGLTTRLSTFNLYNINFFQILIQNSGVRCLFENFDFIIICVFWQKIGFGCQRVYNLRQRPQNQTKNWPSRHAVFKIISHTATHYRLNVHTHYHSNSSLLSLEMLELFNAGSLRFTSII